MEETSGLVDKSISLESFVILAVLTAFITLWAYVKGYYAFGEKEVKKASIWQTIVAFLLFFIPATLTIAILQTLFTYSHAIPGVYRYPLALFIGISFSGALLCLYSKCNIFKNTPQTSFTAWTQGVLTWFLAYPQMILLSALLNFVIINFFGLNPEEQSTVLELKKAKEHSYPSFLILVITTSFIVPICEEILFRGYLQSFLRNIFPKAIAIIIASCIFSLFHFSSSQGASNLVILPSLFFLSLYLGFIFEKWGTLAAPIGLHMAFNFISTMMITHE